MLRLLTRIVIGGVHGEKPDVNVQYCVSGQMSFKEVRDLKIPVSN